MVNNDAPSELIRAKDVSSFDRWALPSFDPEGYMPAGAPVEPAEDLASANAEVQPPCAEVDLETLKPLTLDELEAIRQDAYNEGFSTGEKDGFHGGQLKARQEAEVALKAKLLRLEQVMTHLLEPIAEQDQQLEVAMIKLVSHITRQVIQRELSSDSSQLRQVLREALKLLPMGAGNVRIHINPQDFELVKALRERHEETWRILEDDALQPGGCRVESEHSQIDASIETRLNLAVQQLFEQQREQATNPVAADLCEELSTAPIEPNDAG
ncbi:MAG: flagellar assembly protein FliH [Pseudomonas sp.]